MEVDDDEDEEDEDDEEKKVKKRKRRKPRKLLQKLLMTPNWRWTLSNYTLL
ncbi:hypothetical protein GBAR_LOCUS26078 [Geodia barretti]|uniref:Uncharacterized protein n=1 Tax=Geodia barretti TaxID=519541 RepID=A0AA35THH3_GEOBA|nr:hypothetical protein GBAR_LOCUS26078 [Geodia barretti]